MKFKDIVKGDVFILRSGTRKPLILEAREDAKEDQPLKCTALENRAITDVTLGPFVEVVDRFPRLTLLRQEECIAVNIGGIEIMAPRTASVGELYEAALEKLRGK